MAFVVVVVSGTTLAPGQLVDNPTLNLLGQPTITVTGNLGDLGNVNPAAATDKQVLAWDAGTSKWKASAVPAMVGASSAVAGTVGGVTAPVAGENLKFLRGDGTWQNPSNAPSSDLFAAQNYL